MPFYFINMEIAEIKVSYQLPSNLRAKVKDCNSIYQLALKAWSNETIEMQEEVKVLMLNRANEVIGIYELSKGGISGTVIDIKLILSVALKCLASSVVVIHNHPSGNMTPSRQDISITEKIKVACNYFDITLLDHLIISRYNYYSFANEGRL